MSYGSKKLGATLAKLSKLPDKRPLVKKRKATLTWTIIKYSFFAALAIFAIYSAYTIVYKYGRCKDNKEANQLSYDTCKKTLEREDYSVETKQKAYKDMNCAEVSRKIDRNCVWHGFYSLYHKVYNGIFYLSNSVIVWAAVAFTAIDRIYRWKTMAEDFIYTTEYED